MDGAPSVDLGNEHTRKEFVRIWGSHVTALNPELARVQQQGEGNPLAINPLRYPLTETYCLRKKKDLGEISCRFFFPRDTRDMADVVRRQGQSYFSFEAARNDSLMNHYNRCLSLGWLANIDISPCTSLQAVINYAAKYCSKMEKRTDSYASLGRQILPHVSHYNPLLSFASQICHILLNCELQEGTRVQGRSLRLQGDHDDGEVVGIYDKYLSRPNLHEELTYLDFLANWNTSKRDGTKWTRWGRQAKPRLMLAHLHRDPNQLRKINGVEYASYASAAEFCYGNHQYPDDYYGIPDAEECRPDPDEFEQEYHEPDLQSFKATIGAVRLSNIVSIWIEEQILLQVDGGGGTGKSYMIKVLPIWRAAPTGVISNQIMGTTLYSLLRLPVDRAFAELSLVELTNASAKSFPTEQLTCLIAYRAFSHTVFLKKIERQQGDDQTGFRLALEELRGLNQCEIDKFDAALRIYSKKARVNEYNYKHLNIGWQPGWLVSVYDIGWAPGADTLRDPPCVIMMVMDKYTGPPYLTTGDGREVVPITPVRRDFFLGTSACIRKQFPLISITVDKMVTDLSERDFQTGLSYVAVSRVKMLEGPNRLVGVLMKVRDQDRRRQQQLDQPLFHPLFS
ncbi:uncharacterized protein NECHADRAFT_96587 [Fusarium vanettenii 77-13-4]|uniref:ATP-dependent DNA helicase n=1 Tax=Fusarium vanettenii (strain ATCC MYA-4622 / CBS 123669 / FGSC 9596 / NRRL 45880 / 77-13-4) TaxID=660122 RepID=C7ZNN2_FUSV7|nr:uncharacterized protein NECHADRAFT_96587 [Fusarium vanettenii 77-13-4]EEU34019.1 hypothetical protein NECHADRAFT_96587 [Fusarium vanettenii 77-13-4]